MKTLRKIIEDFIYPRFEFYTELAYREGEDVTYLGIRLLEDEAKFTHGTLVNAAATLYVHYVKKGDKRADEVLERIHYFIEISARNVCKTWGKGPVGFFFFQKRNLFPTKGRILSVLYFF